MIILKINHNNYYDHIYNDHVIINLGKYLQKGMYSNVFPFKF